MTTFQLTSTILSSVFDFTVTEKTEVFLQLDMDPLVLSCIRYRFGNPDSTEYNPTAAHTQLNIGASYLYGKVTPADIELANKIRNYYRGKLAFAKLRGDQMSRFRQDLTAFIKLDWNETVKISENYMGMLYKLPYFYQHDLLLVNEIFETEYQEIKHKLRSKEEVTLTYIRSLDEHQKRNPSIKYWFKDRTDNKVCISIEKANSLIPTWEDFIKKPVTIKGSYIERAYDTLHFYQVSPGWKIIS